MAEARTLHLMEMSMQFSDSSTQFISDIKFALDQDFDLLYLTEAGSFHNELRRTLPDRYQQVFFQNYAQDAFVVKKTDHSGIRDRGSRKVHPGPPRPVHISWVRVKWYDEEIFYHGAHWLNKSESSEARDAKHERTTKLMCNLVKRHGQGAKLAFFAGDTNIPERQDNLRTDRRSQIDGTFRQNGLLTIWDEMEVTPPTGPGGGTVDIIGSYSPDKRVKAKRWKVHPRQHSDHRPISAWYEITKSKGGGGGGKGKPPPKFAQAGNVDFSDYADGTVYPLPYAIDDSDLTNG